MSSTTPVKPNALEEQVIKEQNMTPGRRVRYQSGSVTRVGLILKVLTTPEETPRPPKIIYECYDETKKQTKQYTNNPSMLTVIDDEQEEERAEGELEEE